MEYKKIYHNIIKFGVPVLVLASLILAVWLDETNPGDPEFGALGKGAILILLLTIALIVWLFAALFILLVKKNKLYIISWGLSIAVVLFFVLSMEVINEIKDSIHNPLPEKEYKPEKTTDSIDTGQKTNGSEQAKDSTGKTEYQKKIDKQRETEQDLLNLK